MTLKHATIGSALGPLTLVSDGAALRGLYFEGHKHRRAPALGVEGVDGVIRAAEAQLRDYFAGRRRAFDLPLAAEGTPFQLSVWGRLRQIGFGATMTYAAMALAVGRPRAARAVGAAVGANPHSIITPCHRVIGTGGALTGFAGGEARKRLLLGLESAHCAADQRSAM